MILMLTVNLTGSKNHMRDKPLAMSVKGNFPSPPRPGPTPRQAQPLRSLLPMEFWKAVKHNMSQEGPKTCNLTVSCPISNRVLPLPLVHFKVWISSTAGHVLGVPDSHTTEVYSHCLRPALSSLLTFFLPPVRWFLHCVD